MSGLIFISYRRDDSRYQARMIYEAFLRGMPRENVFMDIDTIPLGVNFVKVLEGWVEQCEVLLVLMGVGWANSTDPKTGKRRLDNPKDFVRVEIRGALTRDIPVVPVMLDGAEIPDEAQLPDDIKGLLSRNPSLSSTVSRCATAPQEIRRGCQCQTDGCSSNNRGDATRPSYRT